MADIRPFARYLAVAAVVGLITVGLREVFVLLLPNMLWQYGWSMILSYALGVGLSYYSQTRFTFGATGHRLSRQGLASFTLLALFSALLTVMLAYVLRFGLPLQAQLPTLAAALAFAVAALLVAPMSFLLGRQLIFIKERQVVAPEVREPLWVWLMLIALVLGHAVLVSQVQLRYNTRAVHDEALFMHMAQSIADGHWLGAYTAMILIKGTGFSLWLAVVHAIRMPVSWAAAFTYSLPCVLVFLALRARLPGIWQRFAVFLALLLCPVVFSGFLLLRELIYPALTLLVVACGLGLVLRLEWLGQRLAPWAWAVALGLSSAQFALTREESIWLLPLWLGIALRALWLAWIAPACARALAAVTIVSALTSLLPILVVASLNQHYYGVFTLLELNSRPFVSAYGALARVRTTPLPQVPVPREVWARLAAVSPAFAEINVHLQGNLGKTWVSYTPSVSTIGTLMDVDPNARSLLSELFQMPLIPGLTGADMLKHNYYHEASVRRRIESILGGKENARQFFEIKNEISGGWFVWALRECAVAAGHHTSAVEANRFYQQLATEVNTACEQGLLACEAERNTLRPPFHASQLAPFGVALATVSGFGLPLIKSSTGGAVSDLGTRADLDTAEAFLHQKLAAGREVLPVVEPIETLLVGYRNSIPWVTGIAMLGWLLATPWPSRRRTQTQRLLWWTGLLLFALVLSRLALVAMIHVTSWPVIDIRYMSAAHPLLVFFDVIGIMLVVNHFGGSIRPLPTSDKNCVSSKYK